MKRTQTLKDVLAEKGIKNIGIAKTLGLTPRTVQDRLSGKRPFSIDEIKKLCETYNIDRDIFFN